MSDQPFPDVPFVQSVLHPSDFSPASDKAFATALAIARRRGTRFAIFHLGSEDTDSDLWSGFPAVRATLERWGDLEKGSAQADVFDQLGVEVIKINMRGADVVKAVMVYLDKHPTDLIVLATEGRMGLPQWLRESVAEQVARRSGTMTLFVPQDARGMVSLEDGTVSLKRILVPVDHDPDPRAGVAYATRAAAMAGGTPVEIVLLHVGGEAMPAVSKPDLPNIEWNELRCEGNPVDEIVRVAEERDADLIVMTTQGHDGFLDALRGSVTEQVLRRAGCSLLAVPAGA